MSVTHVPFLYLLLRYDFPVIVWKYSNGVAFLFISFSFFRLFVYLFSVLVCVICLFVCFLFWFVLFVCLFVFLFVF